MQNDIILLIILALGTFVLNKDIILEEWKPLQNKEEKIEKKSKAKQAA